MKNLLCSLFLFTLFCFGQTRITPDCVIPFNFTNTGSTSNLTCGAPNGQPNGPGISSWILVYSNYNYGAISLVVQSAPDNNGTPGTWASFAGTVLTSVQYPGSSGINPNTAITSAFTGFAGYYPWMRITLASVTGTGSVTGNLYGFYNSTLARAGAGGSGTTIAGTANEIAVAGAGCTGAGTCTISIPSSAIFPGNPSTPGTFTSGSSGGTTGAFPMIGKTSGATSTLSVDDSNTATRVELPNDATSGLYMTTSPTATPAAGCAQYNGTGTEAASTGTPCGSAGGNPTITVANAASTGTTTSTLTKLVTASSASTAVIAATTDTGHVVGITTAGAGTTGNATITIAGLVNCVFSNATTAGDYVQISTATGGDCLDTGGATYPTTGGQVIGRVLSTNVGAGTYQIDLFPAEIQPGSGGGGGGGATRGVFASRPSCGTSGSTYFSTDISVLSECDGSSWADFAYGFPVNLPSSTTFTTVLNSAAITTNGVAVLVGPNISNVYGEDIAIPVVAYTLWVGLKCGFGSVATYCGGIYIRDTLGTKIQTFAMEPQANPVLQTAHFSNYTGLAGGSQDNVTGAFYPSNGFYLRLIDNGTTFAFSYCSDRLPATCGAVFSLSRTANLTLPGFIGWWGTGSSTAANSVLLFDWTVTTP